LKRGLHGFRDMAAEDPNIVMSIQLLRFPAPWNLITASFAGIDAPDPERKGRRRQFRFVPRGALR